MGLAYDTIIEIACKLKGEYKNDVCFNHKGKQWTLSEGQGDFEYVDEDCAVDKVVGEKEPTLHSVHITPRDVESCGQLAKLNIEIMNDPVAFDASLEKRKNGKIKAEPAMGVWGRSFSSFRQPATTHPGWHIS